MGTVLRMAMDLDGSTTVDATAEGMRCIAIHWDGIAAAIVFPHPDAPTAKSIKRIVRRAMWKVYQVKPPEEIGRASCRERV